MIGGVLLALKFVDRNDGRMQTIRAKFKILRSGSTDWVPIILGGMAIDHPDRGGLGIQPQKNSFYLARLQMSVERSERFAVGRHNRSADSQRLEELVFANRSEVVTSALDSEEESETEEEGRPGMQENVADQVATVKAASIGQNPEFARKARSYDSDVLDELVLDTGSVTIPTGGGGWVPVRRRRLSDRGEE